MSDPTAINLPQAVSDAGLVGLLLYALYNQLKAAIESISKEISSVSKKVGTISRRLRRHERRDNKRFAEVHAMLRRSAPTVYPRTEPIHRRAAR